MYVCLLYYYLISFHPLVGSSSSTLTIYFISFLVGKTFLFTLLLCRIYGRVKKKNFLFSLSHLQYRSDQVKVKIYLTSPGNGRYIHV